MYMLEKRMDDGVMCEKVRLKSKKRRGYVGDVRFNGVLSMGL